MNSSTETKPARRASWFERLTSRPRERDRMQPLYEAIVAFSRTPSWYRDGRVPDTVDGRFNMIAAVTALVLVHMETIDDDDVRRDSVLLTELFIEDMDESLRQIGIGDYVVGKHVGRMVGALGGRLGAFRSAVEVGDFTTAVHRNIFHEAEGVEADVAFVAERLARFHAALAPFGRDALIAAQLPPA